jgi:cytochrome P450
MRQLPPGPRIPAALQLLAFWKRPAASIERARQRYGKRFTVRLPFQPPLVILSDPDEIKQLFTAPPEVLHPGEGARLLEPTVGRNSVILLDEAPHLEQRKLLLPAFHGEKMAALTGLMRELTERELDAWPTRQPITLHPRLQRLTLEIILRAVFGLERGQRLDELRDVLTQVLAFSESPLSVLPTLQRTGRWFGPMKRFQALMGRADELIFGLIEERRAAGGEGDDVLAMLLHARHEDGSPMSPQELRDELMTALVAGHETTASQLAWAFERLAREPQVAMRIRADGDDYIAATIHEVMRLRPVLPNAEPRLTKRPIRIGGGPAARERIPRPPRSGDLPGTQCLPTGKVPRQGAWDLHVDSLRRRTPAMPRCELRASGDEDRDPRRFGPLRARARRRAARADCPSQHHVQPQRGREGGHSRARSLASRAARTGTRRLSRVSIGAWMCCARCARLTARNSGIGGWRYRWRSSRSTATTRPGASRRSSPTTRSSRYSRCCW